MLPSSTKLSVIIVIGMAVTLVGGDSYPFKPRSTIVRVPVDTSIIQYSPIEGDNELLPPPLLEPLQQSLPSDRSRKNILRNPINTTPGLSADTKENLTLPSYLDLIFANNITFANGEYEANLDRLESLITKSRYDFDLSFQALVSASQLPTPTEGMGTTLTSRMGIQANKLLYDGGRHYVMNEHSTLMERFAKFKRLSSKDQMKIYGAELYLRLLELQGRKSYMHRYEEITDEMYQRTMQKVEGGVSDNIYDQINAKMDKLALEKLSLELEYDLYNATVSFNQAAYISLNHNLSLVWPHIEMPLQTAEELQKKAIEKSHQIEIADTQFRLKKGELLSEQGRNDWLVNLNAFGGVGYSNTVTNITNSSSQGVNWLVSLQASHPLNEGTIDLAVEKKTVEALKEKNNLILTQQNTVLRVNKLFTDCERENHILNLMSMQKELAERHLKIVKYRFEGGLEPYVAYAASMKKTIEIEEDILGAKIRLARNVFELQVLTGGLD